MGRHKNKVELTVNNLDSIDSTINTNQTIKLTIAADDRITENNLNNETSEQTIYDKYRRLINQSKNGYIRDYQYCDVMDILNYTQRKVGHNIPINFGCSTCVLDMIKLFSLTE
jgi:hypothetical protein